MERNTPHDETDLAELLSLLRPAPQAWVEAAQQRPRIERGVAQILALAEADAEFRRALIEDLEEAVQRAGVDPSPEIVSRVRARME